MSTSLIERFEEYESLHDTKIMQRLPIIIKSNIRNFSKFSKNLEKPYSYQLLNLIKDSMMQTIIDIDGAIFGFSWGGEISIVIKNDIDSIPYYNNKIQTISSIISSMMSINFFKNYLAADNQIDIYGEAIFETKTFAIPNISETINYIIWRQKTCLYNAVSTAAEYELNKIYNKTIVNNMLFEKNISEKIDLLEKECKIDFNNYHKMFYHGCSAYKINKIISKNKENISRKRWISDDNLSDFLSNKEFLLNIMQNGYDAFNVDRDFVKIGDTNAD